MRSKLAFKFLFPDFLVVAVGMSVLFIINSMTQRYAFVKIFKANMALLAQSMLEDVSDDVRTRKDLLTYLAGTTEVIAALKDHAKFSEAGDYLDRFLSSENSSGLGYINLFNTKGYHVISTTSDCL